MEDQNNRNKRWYIVHTYSGYEDKVKKQLERRIATMDMKDNIFHVVVPTEDEVEIRGGQRRTVARKIFPGYILVEMIELKKDDEESERARRLVRETPWVTGFVGSGTEPVPLDEEEVKAILRQMEEEGPKLRITFNRGQSVRVTDGPFADFVGVVDNLDYEKGKVRLLVSFFGRETPLELDFLQVEKL